MGINHNARFALTHPSNTEKPANWNTNIQESPDQLPHETLALKQTTFHWVPLENRSPPATSCASLSRYLQSQQLFSILKDVQWEVCKLQMGFCVSFEAGGPLFGSYGRCYLPCLFHLKISDLCIPCVIKRTKQWNLINKSLRLYWQSSYEHQELVRVE